MSKIQAALGGLSDVEGVIGSFVITDGGVLLGSNLPAIFDAGVFAEAGPRLIRLVEASGALSAGLKSSVLRFPEHKLFVKEVGGALLGVLLTAAASLPALRVATNLLARRLTTLIAETPLSPAEAAPVTDRSPAPAKETAPPAAPQPAAKRPMFFRGNPVGRV